MPFFFDRINGQSGISQYKHYLDNDLYLHELKKSTNDAVNYQLIEIRRQLNEKPHHITKAIHDATKVVCGSLDSGFSEIKQSFIEVNANLRYINSSLLDIDEGIANLHSLLDWKTDQIIELQRITNDYLSNIIQMLKIPESEKQRAEHVETGLRYLKIAIDEGPKSEYYEDAEDEFCKAVAIQSKDYFSLYKLGFIYLHSSRLLDAEKALTYFKQSARHAKVHAFSA